MKRKYLCLVLICALMASLFRVGYAQEAVVTRISGDTAAFIDPVAQLNEGASSKAVPSGNYLLLSGGGEAVYEIDVEEDGTYFLEFTGHGKDALGYFDYRGIYVRLDGAKHRFFNIPLTDGTKDIVEETRGFELTKGTHKLSLAPQGDTYIKALKIAPLKPETEKGSGAYKKVWIPGKIQAEDFDYNTWTAVDDMNFTRRYRPGTGIDIYEVDNEGYYISLKAGEHTEYTFEVDTSGVYSFGMLCFAGEGVKAYFDGYDKPLRMAPNKNIEYEDIAKVYLAKGKHKVRLEPMGEEINIDYFGFKSAAGDYVSMESLDTVPLASELPEEENPVYRNIYVSAHGSDTGTGEENSPFLTLGRAKEEVARLAPAMTGDIVVNVASGYYELDEAEVFGNSHSGRNGYDVIIRGEDKNNPPVISGGLKVDGWTEYGEYMWRAPAPQGIETVRNLYVNNSPAVRARSKYNYLASSNYDDPLDERYTKDGIYVSRSNFPKNLTNHDDIELVFPIEWTSQFALVEYIDYNCEKDNSVLIRMNSDSFNTYATMVPGSGKQFYIENAFELLDEPGEFYYNKKDGYIYYYPYSAEDMNTAEVYVGRSQQLIKINGSSGTDRAHNIVLDNLDMRYSAWDWPDKNGMYVIQADAYTVGSGSTKVTKAIPGAVEIAKAEDIKITNSRITCHAMTGIAIPENSKNVLIEGNLVADLSGSGITVGNGKNDSEQYPMVAYVDILNNAIFRVAGEYRGCLGILSYYTHHINVQHNEINFVPYSGMSLGWGWIHEAKEGYGYFTVKYNRVNNVMTSLLDGSHIYMLGPLRYSEIAYNWLNNGYMGQKISGVYFDSGCKYGNAHHNVITNSPGWYHMSGENWVMSHRLQSNYSNVRTVKTYGDPQSLYFEYPTVIDTDEINWPQEAIDIKESAGLEDEYKYLLELAKEPEWKVGRLETARKNQYISKNRRNGNWIEAEDFMSGENVGWYKKTPLYNQNDYRPDEGVSLLKTTYFPNYVIDTNFDGEWVKWEVEVPEDGLYYVDLMYGHGYGNSASCSRTNVWVDDVPVCEEKLLPGNSWSALRQEQLGTIELTKGKHILKLQILKGGFYIDAIRVHDGTIYAEENTAWKDDNEPVYDEGRYVTEEEYIASHNYTGN